MQHRGIWRASPGMLKTTQEVEIRRGTKESDNSVTMVRGEGSTWHCKLWVPSKLRPVYVGCKFTANGETWGLRASSKVGSRR